MDDDSRGRHAEPTRLPDTAFAGQATFAGALAVIDVAREALVPTLPRLISLPGGSSPEVPCLLMFGEQRDGTTFFGGMPVPWGIDYHELMAAIPFVRLAGVPGEYLYVSGMICDFWPAVWNGNVYYGFKKRYAPMSWDGTRFTVTDDGPGSGFQGELSSCRPASGADLDWIKTVAGLSVLGHRRDAFFVQSRFDWDFRETLVEAATLRLAPDDRFPELPLEKRNSCCKRAYRIQQMRWRLSWPTPVILS